MKEFTKSIKKKKARNKKMRNVQIPYDLFLDICKMVLIIDDKEMETEKTKLAKKIKPQLKEKLDKIVMHDIYTKSKHGTKEEKEEAKREYMRYVKIKNQA